MKIFRGGWLVLLTLAVAFLLTMVRAPLGWPDWLASLRPGWIPLVVFFWAMRVPHRVSLVNAWLAGLFADVVYADPVGLNGLVLASITYVTWRFHERLRMYAVLQQAVVAGALVLVGEGARRLAHGQMEPWLLAILLPVATSMLMWPAVQLLLGNLTQRIRVE